MYRHIFLKTFTRWRTRFCDVHAGPLQRTKLNGDIFSCEKSFSLSCMCPPRNSSNPYMLPPPCLYERFGSKIVGPKRDAWSSWARSAAADTCFSAARGGWGRWERDWRQRSLDTFPIMEVSWMFWGRRLHHFLAIKSILLIWIKLASSNWFAL